MFGSCEVVRSVQNAKAEDLGILTTLTRLDICIDVSTRPSDQEFSNGAEGRILCRGATCYKC
jgi:hypothetical protein